MKQDTPAPPTSWLPFFDTVAVATAFFLSAAGILSGYWTGPVVVPLLLLAGYLAARGFYLASKGPRS
jgi:ABC-type xylose transport system permease subunit